MGCTHAVEHSPNRAERPQLRPAIVEDYVELYSMLLSENMCVCKNTFAIVFAGCIDEFVYTNGQHYGKFRTISAEQYLKNHLVLPIEGELPDADLYYNRMLDAKTSLIRHYLM